jgi:U3 small nucleolar RNA-associated protein 21
MLKMGKYLLTFSREDHTCAIWDTAAEEFALIRIHRLPSDSTVSCVLHPHAYLDKILIGTEEGHLDLFNIHVGELVYRLKPFERIRDFNVLNNLILRNNEEETNDDDAMTISVTCLCNSSVLDVVAIGLSDGQIILHNIRYDKSLFSLVHSPGPITSLSFRTDGEPCMVSGNAKGEIAVWDLNKRSLIQLLSNAHSASVTTLLFVPYEPVLISSGADNTLHSYIFDRSDKPRLENRKEGHSMPPNYIKFYDPSGNWLISAGIDQQVRLTSLVDRITSQISQKLKEKRKRLNSSKVKLEEKQLRLPVITGLDTCYLRQDDWENMVTCHRGSNIVYTWNVKNMSISNKTLYSPEKQFGQVSSICISICGNFAFTGRTKGYVEKWNLQSGTLKAHCTEYMPKGDKDHVSLKIAHHGSVNGIVVDNTNAKVISGGYDGFLKIWDLSKCSLISKYNLGSSITKIVKSKVSNLIAVSTDKFEIYIYDMNTNVLIRKHQKHEHSINDMTFSHDSRLLISCCAGCSIIAYDIVSARVIDWLQVPKMATSLDFHPEGLYLASSHADSVGISLWLNKLLFGNAIIQSVSAPIYVNLPMTSHEAEKINTEEEQQLDIQLGQSMIEKRKRKRQMDQLLSVEDSNSEEEEDAMEDKSEEGKEQERQDALMLDEDFGKRMKLNDERDDSHSTRAHNTCLISFSGISKSKWNSIIHLDELRERNKAANSDASMNSIAPFILSSLPTLSGAPKFVRNENSGLNSKILGKSHNHHTHSKEMDNEMEEEEEDNHMEYSSSELMALIKQARTNGASNYLPVIEKLKSMNPKEIDISIRLINVGNDLQEVKNLVDFFIFMLRKKYYFDLVQALINLFLQVHSELISKSNDLALFDKIDELIELQSKCWNPLDNTMQNSLCLSKYILHQLF